MKVWNFCSGHSLRDSIHEFMSSEQRDLRFNDSHWVSDFEQETSGSTREAKAYGSLCFLVWGFTIVRVLDVCEFKFFLRTAAWGC